MMSSNYQSLLVKCSTYDQRFASKLRQASGICVKKLKCKQSLRAKGLVVACEICCYLLFHPIRLKSAHPAGVHVLLYMLHLYVYAEKDFRAKAISLLEIYLFCFNFDCQLLPPPSTDRVENTLFVASEL